MGTWLILSDVGVPYNGSPFGGSIEFRASPVMTLKILCQSTDKRSLLARRHFSAYKSIKDLSLLILFTFLTLLLVTSYNYLAIRFAKRDFSTEIIPNKLTLINPRRGRGNRTSISAYLLDLLSRAKQTELV